MRRLSRHLATITFLALVLGATALIGNDGPWLGEHVRFEARTPFPQRISQGTLKQLGGWFGDRIGLRYLLIYTAVEYDVALLRWPIARQIALGRDGWLFWTDDGDVDRAHMADFRGRFRFRPTEITTIDANLKSVQERLAGCGITYLTVVVPNKQSIYGQYLGGDEASVTTRLDDLLRRLDPAVRPNVLDLRAPLRAAAAQAPLPIYPKTDTHWNELGAFYAYRAILDALAQRIKVPHRELATLADYAIDEHPYDTGDMGMVLLMPSRFPGTDVLLHPGPALPKVEVKESGYLNLDLHAEGVADAGPVLIFGDSFSPSLAEPLARHFGTVYVRPTIVDGDTIGRLKPRIVLMETVARYAHKLIERPTNLERACAP